MKISINKSNIDDIPVIEYIYPKAEKLLFLQHGIHSKKENVMNLYGLTLAKLGYHVIALDAYKHGARLEEPFLSKDKDQCALETMDVVSHTANDIKDIYHKYYQKSYETFDVIGISMGGLIAYFLSTITKNIDQLVALISSPQFLEAANYTFPEERQEQHKAQSDKVLKTVKKMDPSTKVEAMRFSRLIIFNGIYDEVIPFEQSEMFYENHPELPIIFKRYKTEHKINQEMFEDLQMYLKETFKEKA